MAWSSSSSGSDRDDALGEDMEALRRACMIAGADPAELASDSDDSAGDSSGADDLDLLRSIQERFSSAAAGSPPVIEPFSSLLPPGSGGGEEEEEEDDFETLRAIQRRFSQYESDNAKKKAVTSLSEFDMTDGGTYGPETPNRLSENGKCQALQQAELGSVSAELHQEEDETCNVSLRPFTSQFPKCTQNFVDALKKNRLCQKFVRRKLIEIEAKIEENKRLKERIKCLMDFQLACRKKVGRVFGRKKDPRIRLISMQNTRDVKTRKTSWKKANALCLGPAENSRVCDYKMVMRRFPVSLHKQPWSNIEKDKLMRGIKQQYQEMVVLNSMNFESVTDGYADPKLMLALSSGDLEVTPEKIRSFLPLVNWDRLASMYLPGRSGAECEARWLNCEDPIINHNPWTILEDKKLLFIVQERGLYNWIDISVGLGTYRTPFQCLARYQRSLNPHILNKDWTDDEDAKLRAAVETFGDNNWQMVVSNLEGRTGPQCSNRWRKSLNPDRRKVGRWSVDEDKRLKVAVMLFGAKNWNKIARFAPGRTQVQCRERWLNCLDPSLNLEAWSQEEDAKLLEAIEEHGYSWSRVATCVPGRTDNQCRRRWKVLLPHEVPLLRAARQMKRTVLISNFVDRESERPLIGPSDFSPLVNPPAPESGDGRRNRKKKSSNDQHMNSRAEFKNLSENHMGNSSAGNATADLALAPSVNSNGASKKRKSKRTLSDNNSKRSRVRSKRTVRKNMKDSGMLNSSAEITPMDLSLLPGVSSNTAETGSNTRTRKKMSSNSLPKKSRVTFRRSDNETSIDNDVANIPIEVSPTESSFVPTASLNAAESGNVGRPRKKISSYSRPKSSRAKSRPRNQDGIVHVADVAPTDSSLVPVVTSNTSESGSCMRASKKAPSGGICSRNSSCEDNNTQGILVNLIAAENVSGDVSPLELNSLAAENINSVWTRRRGPRVSNLKQDFLYY